MKKIIPFLILLTTLSVYAQPEIQSWKMNSNGQLASYWQNTNGNPTSPTFVFNTSNSLADVTKVCYDNSSVWVQSQGMTVNMGQFLNPGAPSGQNYTFRLPRIPTVAVNKTTVPLVGAIGVLTNGIPMYGLSNAKYYNGSGNNGMGVGTWNVEVYLSEGFVLDTALGAHPQQQGAYHTHAKPYRLFSATASNVHSPLIGYAFDGYPIYGPYGYSSPTNSASAVARMKTGFSPRSITTRTVLPYGGTLTASQYGPPVNGTYPIGTYSEDYEWLASNNGDLDRYNGRYCVTPDYPGGTYAYFVTLNASGTPEYPYLLGTQYYGVPDAANITMGTQISIPTGVTCITGNTLTTVVEEHSGGAAPAYFPNPSGGRFNIRLPQLTGTSEIQIFDLQGKLIYTTVSSEPLIPIDLSETATRGVFILKVSVDDEEYVTRLVLE